MYRFLCADDPPDHTTISRFWKRFRNQLKSLFHKVLDIAIDHNLVGFEHISGDGVRLASMGSRAMLFDLKNANRHLNSIRRKQKEGRNTNDELGFKLEKALPELEKISKERNKNISEHTTYRHLTEPDARLIKKRTQYMSGYNAQAMVDKKNGIVLHPEIFCNSFDRHNGKPILSAVVDRFSSRITANTQFTFDNGYEDEEFLAYAKEKQLNVFVPINDPDKPNLLGKKKPKSTKYTPKYSPKRNAYICFDNHIIPFRRKQWIKGKAYAVYEKTCTHCKMNDKCIQNGDKRKRKKINRPIPKEDRKEKIVEAKFNTMKYRIGMYDKMKSEESRQIYANRVATVEPVFAQIEANRGFRRFSVWGKKKVSAQWDFVCTVHNITKALSSFYVKQDQATDRKRFQN